MPEILFIGGYSSMALLIYCFNHIRLRISFKVKNIKHNQESKEWEPDVNEFELLVFGSLFWPIWLLKKFVKHLIVAPIKFLMRGFFKGLNKIATQIEKPFVKKQMKLKKEEVNAKIFMDI